MYKTKVVHTLVAGLPAPPSDVMQPLWDLFIAIGDYWALGDDPKPYRSRLRVFMENRVAINPLYHGYYDVAAQVIVALLAAQGAPKAFETLFTTKLPDNGVPTSPTEATKRFVVNEFITMRLAFGGFRSFGAVNYNGWPGGANNPAEPVPYREMGGAA